MRIIVCLLATAAFMFGMVAEERKWDKGLSLLKFLEQNQMPTDIYYDLDKHDKELAEEIMTGVKYHVLIDEESGVVHQVLIPISEEMQIHITKPNGHYDLKMTPILYQEYEESLVVEVQHSPYQDIVRLTENKRLARAFLDAYKRSINFRREVQKGDRLVIVYDQKYRLGQRFGDPVIKASLMETNRRENYVFLFDDGRYYNQKGKEIEGFLLTTPVRYSRISDHFTMRRWHPVLKRYRPHLGIDYAAPRGTPVKAAGDGKVVFKGRKGGYGNTVKVKHDYGYTSLYAHLSKFRRGIYNGKWVKKGQVIGYVGSTGMSTGPHLHFGLYKNGKARNPAKTIRVAKRALNGHKKKQFIAMKEKYSKQIKSTIIANLIPRKIEKFDYLVQLDMDQQNN